MLLKRDREHLRSAREKCGYCPANRAALFHRKCRREIDDDVLEEVTINGFPANNNDLIKRLNEIESKILNCGLNGDAKDAYNELLAKISSMNKESCCTLENLGFSLAKLGRRSIAQDDEDIYPIRASVTTMPDTRARQDALQNAKRMRAGDFFKITSGGDALNCTDMLLSLERKRMKKLAEKMLKKKDAALKRKKLVKEACAIVRKGGPKDNQQLITCIQWKAKLPTKPKGKKAELIKKWNKLKKRMSPKRAMYGPMLMRGKWKS